MNYQEFLATKAKRTQHVGFKPESYNEMMFPFQKHIVGEALDKGRFGIFADCGLGKTFMQLEWGKQIADYTRQPVLLICPLAVAGQTIKEAHKFGYTDIARVGTDSAIQVVNYENIDKLDLTQYAGVILDESSILKNYEGAYRNLIIEGFARTKYKLACTATPAPNDPMELGNHSEFLGVMTRQEMLSMYFVHDGGETAKWRLKGHAAKSYYHWVRTWAIMLSKPSDIGFDDAGYALPSLNYIEQQIKTPTKDQSLFNDIAISATQFNTELRRTKELRMKKTAAIANEKSAAGEDVIIWVKQNEEGEMLRKLIPNSKEISGDLSNELKESIALWFTQNQCLCDTRDGKRSTEKSIMPNGTQKIKNQSISESPNASELEDQTIKSGMNHEKNTIGNITPIIRTAQRSIENGLPIKETTVVGKSIEQNPRTEKRQFSNQKNLQNENQIQSLGEPLENNTELPLNTIENYSKSKIINAQYAGQNPPLSTPNKDCTSITATQPEKSGDCCVVTVTKHSENLKTILNYSKDQSCTCGASKKGKVLISKVKILGYGLNMQNCHNQIFPSLDFSFESLYQAIRRSYRFGQQESVNIFLITTDTMQNVVASIARKQKEFEKMQHYMTKKVLE